MSPAYSKEFGNGSWYRRGGRWQWLVGGEPWPRPPQQKTAPAAGPSDPPEDSGHTQWSPVGASSPARPHTCGCGACKGKHTERWTGRGNHTIVSGGDTSPYGESEDSEYRDPEFEAEGPVGVACDNERLPTPNVARKDVSRGQTNCSTAEFNILREVVKNAVEWLDHTITELTNARKAACRGEILEARHLQPVTACWLKYKLGVCIDDPSVWTKGTFENKTVAEVIRRLVRPRDLLANNEITYICDETCTGNAWTHVRDDNTGQCLPGTPDRIIHLCPPFWDARHDGFREQTIIHEAVHLTHCACGAEDLGVKATIGSTECLAQFVAATNGRKLDTDHTPRPYSTIHGAVQICGFTNRCAAIPNSVFRGNCSM